MYATQLSPSKCLPVFAVIALFSIDLLRNELRRDQCQLCQMEKISFICKVFVVKTYISRITSAQNILILIVIV